VVVSLIKDGRLRMEDPIPDGSSINSRRNSMIANGHIIDVIDALEALMDRSLEWPRFDPPRWMI